MKSWPKIVVHNIAQNMPLVTAGGGTSWAYAEIDAPSVRDIGPYLESIRAHVKTKTKTTNFAWKPVFYWSIDNATWEGPFDLTSAISADGQTIDAAYTTETDFGVHIRYAIAYRATTGTSVESGTVTCFLVFVTKS